MTLSPVSTKHAKTMSPAVESGRARGDSVLSNIWVQPLDGGPPVPSDALPRKTIT